MDLDPPEDDPPLLILGEDEEEIQTETHVETKDTSVNEINEALGNLKKYMEKLEIEVLGDLKSFILNVLSSFLNKFAEALDSFSIAIESVSRKAGDQSVPSTGQASIRPAEGKRTQNKPPSLSYSKEDMKNMLPMQT
nr:hypothetical protein [Tanacetum cinerariifolium]